MLDAKRNGCFVGCNWKITMQDGDTCSGFSGGGPSKGSPFWLRPHCENSSDINVDRITEFGTQKAEYGDETVIIEFK